MVQIVKLKDVLKQYRIAHWVENNRTYKQVTISQTGEVSFRGEKEGVQIGRKRQFLIDLDKYPNTLIFIRQGVFKGGIGIASKEVNGCLVTENMPMFNIVNVEPEYLSFFLKSQQFINAVNTLVPLGTAQKAIHERQLLELEMPLPNKEQQRKIITKLKKIKDKYSLLSKNTINNQDYISKLRQSILSEAVSGKLVPQEPKDEPASELLKKIKVEKEKLIREKKIKKDKPLPPITKEEIPYELPKGWVWVRLGEICQKVHYGFTASADFNKSDMRLLRITDIQDDKVDWNSVPGCEINAKEAEKYLLEENDVLIARTGGTIGKSYIIRNLNVKAVFASYLIRLVPSLIISPDYLKNFLGSSLYWQQLFERSMGTGQPNVNGVSLSNLKFPLPPLPEQKRIVEKVDQLMKLCEELEQKVKENQKNSELLMEAVLREAFEEK